MGEWELKQMPKLLAFAPCEKVIVDKFTNSPSVIGVLQNMGVFVKAGEVVGRDSIIAKPWSIFSLWRPMPEDKGKKFRQISQIVLPDGNVFFAQVQEFALEERPHYHVVDWLMFPIGQLGAHPITMWLEDLEGNAITEKYIHPLYVHHMWLPVEAAPSEQETK
jgi:hypothetical protein